MGIHAMLAAGLKTEELALDKEEAKELAQGIANVNAYYGKVIDPKVMAWTGLIMTCGKVYAPRVAAIKLRMSMNAPQKPAPRQPLRPVPPPTSAPAAAPAVFPPSINPLG